MTNYYRMSSFCRLLITNTDATFLVLRVYSDYPTGQKFLKILKDGTQSIVNLSAGETYLQIDITGITNVEIVNCPQGDVDGVVQGTFFVSAQFFGGTATITDASNPVIRLLVYGDSIIQGGSTVNGGLGSWPYQLRADMPVIIDGWSGREIHDDADTDAKRIAYAARIAEANPSHVWLAIGYNDYANAVWSDADFGAAYADLLDRIHAALPAANIYAQTMLDAWVETANALGKTLPNYRTAISNAQSLRSAWCALVNGPAMLDPATGLLDGIHPNAVGHADSYIYAKTEIGI